MEWIKVTDKLPEKGVDVLICGGGYVRIMERMDWVEPYGWTDLEGPPMDADEVTHWQPLPPAPEEI